MPKNSISSILEAEAAMDENRLSTGKWNGATPEHARIVIVAAAPRVV
jgi:hypothetical protein